MATMIGPQSVYDPISQILMIPWFPIQSQNVAHKPNTSIRISDTRLFGRSSDLVVLASIRHMIAGQVICSMVMSLVTILIDYFDSSSLFYITWLIGTLPLILDLVYSFTFLSHILHSSIPSHFFSIVLHLTWPPLLFYFFSDSSDFRLISLYKPLYSCTLAYKHPAQI